MVPAIPLELD